MAEKLKIISYENDFVELEGFEIGKRNLMYWRGEVETDYDFVFSKDQRIIDAYAKFKIPLFISKAKKETKKPRRRAPAKKKQESVKNPEKTLQEE